MRRIITLGIFTGMFFTTNIIAEKIKVYQHNIYNQILIGDDLEIDVVTDPEIIERCTNCPDFPNNDPRVQKVKKKPQKIITYEYKLTDCSKAVENQPRIKFKKPQRFKAIQNLTVYKQPANCPSVKTDKLVKKGSKFTAKYYSKFGWVKVPKIGWVKGYMLDPKITYKPKLKKVICPICKDWSK